MELLQRRALEGDIQELASCTERIRILYTIYETHDLSLAYHNSSIALTHLRLGVIRVKVSDKLHEANHATLK